MRQNHFVLLCLALLSLTACDPPAMTDAGVDAPAGDTPMTPDVPRDAPVAPPVCSGMIRTQNLAVGPNTVLGDTTGGGTDLVLVCGNEAAPSEVVELVVPGTAATPHGIILDLNNDETMFDTILEVRTMCGDEPGADCNDDSAPMVLGSRLQITRPGGTRMFVVVSGYDGGEFGPWTMDVTVLEDPQPPTITAVNALMLAPGGLRAEIMGGDADGDAAFAIVEFLDAAGVAQGADVDADAGTPDITEFRLGFRPPVPMMTTFTTNVRLPTLFNGMTPRPLEMFPTLTGATQLRVRLVDSFDTESAPLTVPLTPGMLAVLGGTCDATNICPDSLECAAMVCAVPPAVATACMAATPVMLAAPTGAMRTTMTVDGTIDAAPGNILAPCEARSAGAELLYTVTVPAGMHDLVITTAGTRTAGTDTIVYVMRTCGDTSTEPPTSCHDDIDFPSDPSSLVVVQNASGVYTVAVDQFLGMPATAAADVGTTFALRPVLATGAACDPMEIENRCAGGACPTAGMAMCP